MVTPTTTPTPRGLSLLRSPAQKRRDWRARAGTYARVGANGGFTLIEILTVIAIIGIMAGLLGYAFRGRGTESYGLQAAQGTVASLLTLARSQAAVDGANVAFFLNANQSNAERYLRFIVPVRENETTGLWEAVGSPVVLPSGCYVVPDATLDSTQTEAGSDWSEIQSTAFAALETARVDSTTDESYYPVEFTPRGTPASNGNIVVATGRPNPPGASSPFVFTNPDNVRGIKISAYGQLTFLNNRSDL